MTTRTEPADNEQQAASTQAGPGRFWPNGARLVISISMQFEAGAQSEHGNGGPFPPMDPAFPDLPARTWFEYGMREGIPRMLDLWDQHDVKVTSHMTGQAVERNPALAREIVERGHEAAAHGQTWTPHWTLTPEQERASYQANIDALVQATGTRPVGYNAFWMRSTPRTLAILQELGFTYHIDDLSADEPMTTTVNGKPFAIVPYTIRMNDLGRYGAEGPLTAAAFGQELKDEFDQLYAEAAGRRRMMMISAHDRVTGTPARTKRLGEFLAYAKQHPGVAFVRKDQIAQWALSMSGVPNKDKA
ncbi:MAG TPA: polysaccharide deacetylase family protein [Ramlibacter sp.]|jgi:peptidoglycan/xylan/chitin deacetylase (PgdA/CDA1 family)